MPNMIDSQIRDSKKGHKQETQLGSEGNVRLHAGCQCCTREDTHGFLQASDSMIKKGTEEAETHETMSLTNKECLQPGPRTCASTQSQ